MTPTGLFHRFVPQVVRAFREAFPQISLTLEESLPTGLIEGLRNEQLDVAFLRRTVPASEGLIVHPLLEEPMVVALPGAHRLARSKHGGGEGAVSMKDLAGETFVFYARQLGQPAFYEATMAACHRAGFSPRIGQEAPRVASALSLVAVGLGVAIVPASMRRMAMDGVAYRPLAEAAPPKAILTLAARRDDPSPVVRHFLALVRREARRFDAETETRP